MSKKVASLNVRRMPIASLLPHPKNPRNHPPEGSPEWTHLAASLAHDYFDPIIWNERNGLLVSGHYRTKVFASQAVTEVDVVVVDYDEPTHEARMLIANKFFGTDDAEKQRAILTELAGLSEFDWSLAGIDENSLADFGVDLGGGSLFDSSSPFYEKPPAAHTNEAAPVPAPSPEMPPESALNPPPKEAPPKAAASAPSASSVPAVKSFTMIFSHAQTAEVDRALPKLKELVAPIHAHEFGVDGAGELPSIFLYLLRQWEASNTKSNP